MRADLSRGVATGWGRDTLVGVESLTGSNNGPNTLIGDGGDNVLYGGIGPDTIEAGAGDDVVDAKGGENVLDGGRGVDQVQFPDDGEIEFLTVGVEVDLAEGRAALGPHTYRLEGFEDVEGTEFDDVLRGDQGPNFILGTSGSDTVEGRGGDDRLQGFGVDGGDGHDVCQGPEQVNCEAEGEFYRQRA